jgi:hypothetical protein
MPGIRAFEASAGVGDSPYYYVIQLGSLETRAVSQAQAFSGRDDDVEEWAAQRLAPVPRSLLPLPRSRVLPRSITREVRRPLPGYAGDGTMVLGPYRTGWELTPPPFTRGHNPTESFPDTPQQAASSSPFSFSPESDMTFVSTEEYYQSEFSPPTTSSSYGTAMFANSSISAAPIIDRSNYQNAVNLPPPNLPPPLFGYPSPLSHPMDATDPYALHQAPAIHPMDVADPYALHQAPAAIGGMNYESNALFGSALCQRSSEQQTPYPAQANTFYSPAALLGLHFPGASQPGYYGDMRPEFP